MMTFERTISLLQDYGITLPAQKMVNSADEAVAAATDLGFPVALKAISPDVTHKSDRGFVRLGLDTPNSVKEAARSLLKQSNPGSRPELHGSHVRLEGLLVQEMIGPGVEMIVGVHQDDQFGPLVALGSGGILVELLDDIVLRLPPLTHKMAKAMIRESKSWPLLQGFRGKLPADVAALAKCLVDVSRLAIHEEGLVASLDLNPVIVLPKGRGISIVDSRIELVNKIVKASYAENWE